MSWCRWGSRCDNTIPQTKVDAECAAKGCPGSQLYIYESMLDTFVCCGCLLSSGDFECKTEEEMNAHILEHDAAGHHVRRSLLASARGENFELTDKWARVYRGAEKEEGE